MNVTLLIRQHFSRMRTARLLTVRVSVVCQYLCISGEGEGEVGSKVKKFEQVCSDDHQMSVVGEYCIQVPCPGDEGRVSMYHVPGDEGRVSRSHVQGMTVGYPCTMFQGIRVRYPCTMFQGIRVWYPGPMSSG